MSCHKNTALFYLTALTVLFSIANIFADDGFAVAARLKSKSGDENNCIVKYTITNNKVTATDTLYKGICYMRPVISFDGNYVAFGGKFPGAGKNDPSYLLLVDADGGEVRALDTLSSWAVWYDKRHLVLDWPAGKFMYYSVDETSIWRVNIEDTTDKAKAVHLPKDQQNDKSVGYRKWSVSAKLDYTAVQYNMCNKISKWPFDPGRVCSPGGCNVHVSASGTYYNYFSGSGHVQVLLAKWDGVSEEAEGIGNYRNDSMSTWAGVDISRGMDWPTWSANSDKWMCLQVGRPCTGDGLGGRFMGCGSNQVLFNWIDTVVIMTTDNKSDGDWADAGDMWIQPPQGVSNAYETIEGAWIAADGTGIRHRKESRMYPAAVSGIIIAGSEAGSIRINVCSNETHSISVYDTRGAEIYSFAGSGTAAYHASVASAGGMYVVKAHIGTQIICRRIAVR